jgi:hypothetical protein
MAIKYDEIYSKVMNNELTDLELKYVKDAEEYIDHEIEKQFGKRNFNVEVNNSIPTFYWSPKLQKQISDVHEVRKQYLIAELKKRYDEAGWKMTVRLDDSGGMNSCDYCILSKK